MPIDVKIKACLERDLSQERMSPILVGEATYPPAGTSRWRIALRYDDKIRPAKAHLQKNLMDIRATVEILCRIPISRISLPTWFPLEISTNSEEVIIAAQESWGPFPKLQSAKKSISA